jgi:hypothetical protein
MVALKGERQHFAIVCAAFARFHFLLQLALYRAASDGSVCSFETSSVGGGLPRDKYRQLLQRR